MQIAKHVKIYGARLSTIMFTFYLRECVRQGRLSVRLFMSYDSSVVLIVTELVNKFSVL